MRIFTLLLTMLVFFCPKSVSQVTIGSANVPVSGSLLDMKQTSSNGANSTKGMLLPRVYLTTVNQLTDISVDSPESAATKLLHTGLTVYNTNAAFPNGIGICVWDGSQWANTQQIKSNVIAFIDPGTNLLSLNLLSPLTGWRYFGFPSEFLDTKDEYSTSTGIYTAKNGGLYQISLHVVVSGLSLLSTSAIAVYKKKVGDPGFSQLYIQSKSVVLGSIEVAIKETGVALNAGDQLIFAVQNGTILTLNVGDSGLSYAVIAQQ